MPEAEHEYDCLLLRGGQHAASPICESSTCFGTSALSFHERSAFLTSFRKHFLVSRMYIVLLVFINSTINFGCVELLDEYLAC